jgi:hypothetical protein
MRRRAGRIRFEVRVASGRLRHGFTKYKCPLDYELYGVDPLAAGPASDPGSYEVLNGALGKFDDAFNIELYALENGGAIDPNVADFIGSESSIDHALGLANATDAAEYFYNFGVGDLSGFFQADLSFLDITPAI